VPEWGLDYIPVVSIDITNSQSLVQDERPAPAIASVDAVPARVPVVAQVTVFRLPHAPVGVELIRDVA
jgi:hypothetical protein